jgi:hypothetical protein
MKTEFTRRNFGIVEFDDANGRPCSLQQSSAIGDYDDALDHPGASFVWLGRSGNRMHLSRELVKELVEHLNTWLDVGRFEKGRL